MAAYVARRVAASLLLVLLVLTLVFFFIQLAPGDPALVFEDPRVPVGHQERLRAVYGLDRPLAEQYLAWLRAVVLDFDWGTSFSHSRPVRAVILDTVPNTLLLAAAALAVQFGLGILLGVGAARRPGSAGDHAIRLGSLLLYALPSFWLGLMAVLLLSHTLGIFPSGQMRSVDAAEMGLLARGVDLLRHLALPALVLGLSTAGGVSRFARASLLDTLRDEYVTTARAKGLAESRVLWVHALRNALPPLVQLLGLSLPFLLSGALVIEIVFSWPGMGRLVFDAVGSRDYPLILGATALAALLVVTGNLVADLLQAAVDPRVRRRA